MQVIILNGLYNENKNKMLENVDNAITKDYYDILKNSINEDMDYYDILKYLPELYKLQCNIVSDKKTSWYSKILINCSLAYFVLEKDIIPDLTKDGYMDDLFLATHVLKEIMDNVSKNIILDNINGLKFPQEPEEFLDLIYNIHSTSSNFLGDKTKLILDMVGLEKFNSLHTLFNQKKEPKLIKLRKKRRLLYSMVAVKVNKFRKHSGLISEPRLKDYILRTPELSEIERYISFLDNQTDSDLIEDNLANAPKVLNEKKELKIQQPKIYSELLHSIFDKLPEHSNLKYIPLFFNLLQKVYSIQELPWNLKFKINCCLSYFVIPLDVIPDDIKDIGYIDDLYLCNEVLGEIFLFNPKFILNNWDVNFKEIHNKISSECDKNLIGHQKLEILRLVGLLKFDDISEELGFLIDNNTLNLKVQSLENTIYDLMMILKTIFIHKGIKLRGRNLKDYRGQFEEDEWDTVLKIIEDIELYESVYDASIEKTIEPLKDRIISEINEDSLDK